MPLKVGDQVLVNVAPFIASPHQQSEAVACSVLEVDGRRLKVCTCDPLREIELWIDDRWVQRTPPQQAL